MKSSLTPWLLATRPKTLTAAVAPIFLATALAYQNQKFLGLSDLQWSLSVWALLTTLFLQIGTNLVNDAQDFVRGTDTPARLGPVRVTQSGLIPPKVVMLAAGLSFLLAFACGLPLILAGGPYILALGVLSILAAYAYTAGPYPLAYHGLGEVFVILFFGLVAVAGLGFLHLHQVSSDFLVAGLQLGLLCSTLLIINNARDIDEDQQNHKWTLAARFGLRFARAELCAFFAAAYLLNIYWVAQEQNLAALLSFLSLPLAIKVILGIGNEAPSKGWNKYLAMSSLCLLTFSLLLGTGFFLSTHP